jgi:dTDP-4-amino-4,6-dideoxygalactose transaminase
MITPIPYGRQNITEEDIQAVIDTLRSDYLTQGPKIAEFEKAFAHYVGSKYALTVCNCTDAWYFYAFDVKIKVGFKIDYDTHYLAALANPLRIERYFFC